jgi:hypothetical protein
MSEFIHKIEIEYVIKADSMSEAKKIAEQHFEMTGILHSENEIIWSECDSTIAYSDYRFNDYGKTWESTTDGDEVVDV